MDHDPNEMSVREAPSQATFIGYLAIGLLVLALLVGAFGLIAGASHGWS